MKKPLDFGKAFHYPFNRAKALWNILWILVPIYGWFALGGYVIRIINEFIKGKFKKLPKMHSWPDFKLGLMMFIKSLPFGFVYLLATSFIDGSAFFFNPIWATSGGIANFFLAIFIVPILGINFFKKKTVASYFEFKIIKYVFENFSDYVIAILKTIGLSIIFLVMSIILIGIPASAFTRNIFIADFYRRNVKNK